MTGTYRVHYLNERGSYQSRRVEAASIDDAERRVRAETDRDGESFGQLISVWGHTATLRGSVPQLDIDGVSLEPVAIELSYTRGAPHTITLTLQNAQNAQNAGQNTGQNRAGNTLGDTAGNTAADTACTTWVLSRSLLTDALEHPVRTGEVHITTHTEATDDVTVLTLGAGPPIVLVTDDLLEFLLVTEAMVKPGTEDDVRAPALAAWIEQLARTTAGPDTTGPDTAGPDTTGPDTTGRPADLTDVDLDVLHRAAQRDAPVLLRAAELRALIGEVRRARTAGAPTENRPTTGDTPVPGDGEPSGERAR